MVLPPVGPTSVGPRGRTKANPYNPNRGTAALDVVVLFTTRAGAVPLLVLPGRPSCGTAPAFSTTRAGAGREQESTEGIAFSNTAVVQIFQGQVAEWFKVLVLKTRAFESAVGSNPIPPIEVCKLFDTGHLGHQGVGPMKQLCVLLVNRKANTAQKARASVCGSESHGFNSHHPPFIKKTKNWKLFSTG